MKILYCFITHQKNIINCYPRIKDMMESLCLDYLVCYGGIVDEYDDNTKILQLKCNDFYEGLPEKVIKIFRFITDNKDLSSFDYYAKLDDDMTVNKSIPDSILNADYIGRIFSPPQLNRYYHIGRCSPNSKFNNSAYEGESAKSWCLGGNGYLLSRRVLEVISKDESYNDEIYEDMYISKILEKHSIFPTSFNNIQQYLSSPNH